MYMYMKEAQIGKGRGEREGGREGREGESERGRE